MEVKFIKNHVLGNVGDIKSLSQPKAKYLLRCGVVEVVKEKPKAKPKAKPKRTPKNKATK